MPFVSSVRGNYTAGKRRNGDISSRLLISGGTLTTAGGYRIHTFTTVGSATLDTSSLSGNTPVEYLVIGGGASGGHYTTTNANGGGGAGGYQSGTVNLPNAILTIDVGAGGTNVAGNSQGNDGNDSRIANTSSSPVVNHVIVGGGGGGGYGTYGGPSGRNGTANGGSGGGGGGANANNPGSRSGPPAVQAFPGGCCGYTWTGSGGGGAGSIGISGNAAGDVFPAGNGGRGIASSITGTLVRRGGGGGGGGNSSERSGQGYDGGGRGYGSLAGQTDSPTYAYNVWPAGFFGQSLETAGTPGSFGNQCMPGLNGTGGGGGAGSYWMGNAGVAGAIQSGAGGNGIVVIRYIP